MYVDSHGQVVHYITGSGPVIVARVLMERYLGRELTKDEIVHHVDRDPTNNKVENLQVIARGEHTSFHQTGKVVPTEVRQKISKTLTGHPGANLGKTFTEEHRRKIGEANSKSLKEYYKRKRILEEQTLG